MVHLVAKFVKNLVDRERHNSELGEQRLRNTGYAEKLVEQLILGRYARRNRVFSIYQIGVEINTHPAYSKSAREPSSDQVRMGLKPRNM